MNILYIGDIMGDPGIEIVEQVLPGLITDKNIDLVIAQAENVTNGKGMSIEHMDRLKQTGIQFFSGGNHTPKLPELNEYLEDENQPVTGPANMPNCPGRGWKYINTEQGRVLVVSLMGEKVGTPLVIDNPLKSIDEILSSQSNEDKVATVVNFHGDFSSEKRIIGYYLDGRVTAVVGDHWHVPSADAMVLPHGTAHVTDVGMCGALHSSLGVTFDSVIPRWRDNIQTKNELELSGPRQFNAVLIDSNTGTGQANSIERIQIII